MTPSSDAPVPPGVATLYAQARAANGAYRPADAERLLRRALRALETGRPVAGWGREEEPFPSYAPGPAGALEEPQQGWHGRLPSARLVRGEGRLGDAKEIGEGGL